MVAVAVHSVFGHNTTQCDRISGSSQFSTSHIHQIWGTEN